MNKLFIILVLTFSSNISFTQIIGKCIDLYGKPIPYVNIGIKNSSVGTVTDTDGVFKIDDKFLTDNVTIIATHIGYDIKSIIATKNVEIEIRMTEAISELSEVKIEPSKYKFIKDKRIGNNSLSKNVVLGFSSSNLGAEVGKLFKVKKGQNIKIEKIHFEIAQLGYKKGTFRINFYNATNNEDIEKVRINDEDIIMEVSSVGNVDIDIKNNNLVLEHDFLVSIECINVAEKKPPIFKEKKIIYFSSNVFCGPVYLRSNNLSKWNASKQKYNMGLGIQLFVKY